MKNPTVFIASLTLILFMLVVACVFGKGTEAWFVGTQSVISTYAGWFYIVSMSGFLLVAFGILISPVGSIRLGKDDERPAFPLLTWFAMLFSAGMGIGLLFYGIAEPIMHYANPPFGEGLTPEAAKLAMSVTFFHWGLHPWAIYSLMALSFAYFSYRKGLPLSVRSCLHSLIGDRIHGPIGHAVDTLAIVATLFGVATSLGLGAAQLNSGLNAVFRVPENTTVRTFLIVGITIMATISVVTGLKAGIRRLSETNMLLATCLLLFVLIAGPTAVLFSSFFENLGGYGSYLMRNSFRTGLLSSEQENKWLSSWTLFYWGWWIAWAPFVGMFIAQVSRGRTIREFLLGTLLVPSLLGFIWLTIFGNSAIFMQMDNIAPLVKSVNANEASAMFVFLEHLPAYAITSIVGMTCIILFFVTSSDSASLVIDTIASGGSENPPVWQRIFWATLEGIVAIILMYAGGLKALQSASITVALPFCALMIVMFSSLILSLYREHRNRA